MVGFVVSPSSRVEDCPKGGRGEPDTEVGLYILGCVCSGGG